MTIQDKDKNKLDIDSSKPLKIIAKRYRINSQLENSYTNVYEGHDTKQKCDIVIFEINVPVDQGTNQNLQFMTTPINDSNLNGLIRPCQIVEDNKSYFAIFTLPKSMSLKKNIEMMNRLNQPFCEKEIIRIGQQLCKLSNNAESNNLLPVVCSELVFIAIDGTFSVIAIEPQHIPKATKIHIIPPIHAISNILKEISVVGRQQMTTTSEKRISEIPSKLKQVLQLSSSENSQFDKLEDFSYALKQQESNHKYLKGFTRLGIGIFILVASFIFFSIYKPGDLSKNEAASKSAKLAIEDIRSDAHAIAKEWKILSTSKHLNTTPQAIDADHLLSKGDEYLESMQFEKARLTYRQSIALNEIAITLGKEIVKSRTEAKNARELARLSQSRWLPLFSSAYVQLPEQVKKASDTAFEGDFQFLKQRYSDAVIAYELARQLYDMISPEKYNKLLYRHQAGTSRDRANIAANSWDKLEAAIDTKASVTANKAKKQIVTGEGLLQSGQHLAATHAFDESATLFETATKATIEGMVARVASANAYERATDAAQRWQTLFRAMKQTVEPDDIAEAKASLENAHLLANQEKHKESSKNYERAAALYELQIEHLNKEAKTLAKNYEKRAIQMNESLALSLKGIENRLAEARNKFEDMHTQIIQHNEPDHHEKLLKESAEARKIYRHISKLHNYCTANIHSGIAYDKANSMLMEGQRYITQGEYVAAFVVLEDASSELTSLSELPVAIENYINTEEQTLVSKEKATELIGPLASKLPEVKKLLDLAKNSMLSASEFMQTRDVTSAIQALEDTKLAFDSLALQAEVELYNHALAADSELRTEVALAALNELLVLNPEHKEALKLMKKIQSSDRATNRITIIQGKIRYNGKVIPYRPSEQALYGILGESSRIGAGHTKLIFDDLGILAIPDIETKKIFNIVVYYAKPDHKSEPENFYPGIIEIDGFPIGRDTSIERINASLKHLYFKPTRTGNSYKATHKNLRILINYKAGSDQIFSVSMLYEPDIDN